MRDEDEADPKKPRPILLRRKGDNLLERQERGPREVRPGGDPDRHAHVGGGRP